MAHSSKQHRMMEIAIRSTLMHAHKVKPLCHSTREINESGASLAIGVRNESHVTL